MCLKSAGRYMENLVFSVNFHVSFTCVVQEGTWKFPCTFYIYSAGRYMEISMYLDMSNAAGYMEISMYLNLCIAAGYMEISMYLAMS